MLRSAIDEAVTDGIIQLNPVSQISVDRYKSTTVQQNEEYEVDPFTPQEIALILIIVVFNNGVIYFVLH